MISVTSLVDDLHCLYRSKQVVDRKMKASEQPTPIPAFAAVEKVDFLGGEGDKEFLGLELEEKVLGVCIARFESVLVEVLDLF